MTNDSLLPSVMVDGTRFADEAAMKIAENFLLPWFKGNG
jgi:hypothetical protein